MITGRLFSHSKITANFLTEKKEFQGWYPSNFTHPPLSFPSTLAHFRNPQVSYHGDFFQGPISYFLLGRCFLRDFQVTEKGVQASKALKSSVCCCILSPATLLPGTWGAGQRGWAWGGAPAVPAQSLAVAPGAAACVVLPSSVWSLLSNSHFWFHFISFLLLFW